MLTSPGKSRYRQLKRLFAVALGVMICSSILETRAQCTAANMRDLRGDWQEVDYEGLQVWNDGRCSTANVTERRMGFDIGVDGVGYGTYSSRLFKRWILSLN